MRPEPGHVLIAKNGTPIRLSPSAYGLLRAVESGTGFEALASSLSRSGRTVTAAEVESSYERLTAQIRSVERGPGPRVPPGFLLRRRLLPRAAVARVASRLTVLFASPLVAALVLAIVLTAVASSPLSARLQFEYLWPAYLLFIVSLLAHEIGHATACVRYGAPPSEIGVAIYWIYPAFYVDVTRAWQLGRRRRVVVDLGGVYFQLIVGAGYAAAYAATGWPAFSVATRMILLSCLVSVTPVFRLDGYWALADALGSTRLDREPGRLLSLLADRFRGRRGRAWPWSPLSTAVIALYSAVSLGGWIFLMGRLAPAVQQRAARLPAEMTSLIRSLASESVFDVDLLGSLLVSAFLFLVSGLMIRQLFQRTARWFGQVVS